MAKDSNASKCEINRSPCLIAPAIGSGRGEELESREGKQGSKPPPQAVEALMPGGSINSIVLPLGA